MTISSTKQTSPQSYHELRIQIPRKLTYASSSITQHSSKPQQTSYKLYLFYCIPHVKFSLLLFFFFLVFQVDINVSLWSQFFVLKRKGKKIVYKCSHAELHVKVKSHILSITGIISFLCSAFFQYYQNSSCSTKLYLIVVEFIFKI